MRREIRKTSCDPSLCDLDMLTSDYKCLPHFYEIVKEKRVSVSEDLHQNTLQKFFLSNLFFLFFFSVYLSASILQALATLLMQVARNNKFITKKLNISLKL